MVRNRSTTRYNVLASVGNGSLGSTSESMGQRPLLFPKEVTEMPRRKSLVFKSGQPAILSDRVLYFRDRTLRRRAAMGGVNLPRQNIEDYYAYMASQRGFAQAFAEADQAEEGGAVDFDFKAEVEQVFDDLEANAGDFAPANITTTLAAMKGAIAEADASAYRLQLAAEMSARATTDAPSVAAKLR